MTTRDLDHRDWDELAAASALHALEPEEAASFANHLVSCPACREAVAAHEAVAAQLAYALPAAAPPASLYDRIRSITAAGPPGGSGRAVPLRRARHALTRRTITLVAAAVIVVAALAGGLTVGLGSGGSGGTGSVPLASVACAGVAGCHVVALRDAAGVVRARAVVRGTEGWLVVSGLKPDDQRSETYVLWQLATNRPPLAVSAFDVTSPVSLIALRSLPVAYADSRAFAISLERGRAAPPSPSRPIVVGTVS